MTSTTALQIRIHNPDQQDLHHHHQQQQRQRPQNQRRCRVGTERLLLSSSSSSLSSKQRRHLALDVVTARTNLVLIVTRFRLLLLTSRILLLLLHVSPITALVAVVHVPWKHDYYRKWGRRRGGVDSATTLQVTALSASLPNKRGSGGGVSSQQRQQQLLTSSARGGNYSNARRRRANSPNINDNDDDDWDNPMNLSRTTKWKPWQPDQGKDDDNSDDNGWDSMPNTGDLKELLNNHAPSRRSPKTATANDDSSSSSHFYSRKALNDPAFVWRPQTTTTDTTTNCTDQQQQEQIFEQLCHNVGLTRPSKIQAMAWPVLLSTSSSPKALMIADQTGSGKTLAYLLPLLQRALWHVQHATATTSNRRKRIPGTPLLLILAPTSELADQIRDVCMQLLENIQQPAIKTVVITGTGKYATNIRDQIRLLERQPTDILISTPGRIATILRMRRSSSSTSSLLRNQSNSLDAHDDNDENSDGNPSSPSGRSNRVLDWSHLMAVVMDEVDVLLLDETFGPQLQTIGTALQPQMTTTTTTLTQPKTADTGTQFVFVTATLPDVVVDRVRTDFGSSATSFVAIRGPGLHRVAPTLHERLVDVSVPPTQQRNPTAGWQIKADAILLALRQTRCHRTLVFCNTVEQCRRVENLLSRQDRHGQTLTVLAYHNAITPSTRQANLDQFCQRRYRSRIGKNNQDATDRRVPPKRAGRNHDDTDLDQDFVLVCTDRAARGIDFDRAAVDHVVIVDFPSDPIDYVRRVGRTARAGRTGTVTVLAYGWQLPIAKQVMKLSTSRLDLAKLKNIAQGNSHNGDDDIDDFGSSTTAGSGEYIGGVEGRHSQQRGRKQFKTASDVRDDYIKGHIQGGQLWSVVDREGKQRKEQNPKKRQ